MQTLSKKLGMLGTFVAAFLIWGCEKATNQATTTNEIQLQTLTTENYVPPCKGECCGFTQGHWFAKPNVVWPQNLTLGCNTYTKAEGQALWDAVHGKDGNNSPLFKAFFQAAAVILSGTPIPCDNSQLHLDVGDINNYLCTLPKITPNNLDDLASITTQAGHDQGLQAAADFIGRWLDTHPCEDQENRFKRQ